MNRKRIILIAIGVFVVAAVAYGFLPEPVAVEVAHVQYGPMEVVVEEEGATQVAHPYVLSSPVTAYARRVELEEGDRVSQGDPIVYLEPPRSSVMDPRSQAQARARVDAAEAALEQARENVRSAAAAATEAEDERERAERLFEAGSVTQQMLEQAEARAEQAQAALEAARAAVVAAGAELAGARAGLEGGTAGVETLAAADVLRSPVDGQILSILHRSAGQVNPGQPLVEVGNTNDLEVHADVLSQDAVRIQPGTKVLLDEWGGNEVLETEVIRVEPQGFSEISSLGVEEKRVTVVAGLPSPPPGLGASYRVLARFIVWEGERVLHVPTSALFRNDEGWAVFVVEDGRAALRPVQIGHQTGRKAQLLGGLEEGQVVIVHPDNSIHEGAAVEARNG